MCIRNLARASSPTVASVPLTSSDSRMPAQPADAATGGGRGACAGPDRTEVLEAADAADRTDPTADALQKDCELANDSS